MSLSSATAVNSLMLSLLYEQMRAPRLRSQTTMSMRATQTQGDRIIVSPSEGVQDWPRYIVQKSEALQQLATRARTFDRLRCLV